MDDFGRAFGDALSAFLDGRGITQSDAANRLGLDKAGKARISTYCHDSPKGTRPRPSAEILYLACAELGFAFEYRGYKITAAALNGSSKAVVKPAEQLSFPFNGQFDLTDEKGTVSVTVKRPPGRIEVSLTLRAAL
jgi:transcriptional regulator with XRE-family HTH domain